MQEGEIPLVIDDALTPAEEKLLRGVLHLGMRPVTTIMTRRRDVEVLNSADPPEKIFSDMSGFLHAHVLVLDAAGAVEGMLRRDSYFLACVPAGPVAIDAKMLQPPLRVAPQLSVIGLLEVFRQYPAPLAVVQAGDNAFEGVVTHLDVLEAIAGAFPARHEPYQDAIRRHEDESYVMNGAVSIYELCETLEVAFTPDGRFTTLGGLILHELGRVAKAGDSLDWQGWRIDIRQMDGRRVSQARVRRLS